MQKTSPKILDTIILTLCHLHAWHRMKRIDVSRFVLVCPQAMLTLALEFCTLVDIDIEM